MTVRRTRKAKEAEYEADRSAGDMTDREKAKALILLIEERIRGYPDRHGERAKAAEQITEIKQKYGIE